MASFNKVILMGNLTRDPELRYTPKGMAVARIGLAVNRTWRTEAGENREEATFVDCDAYGRQAETLCQYLKKGSPVLLEGRLRLHSWEDKQSGQKQNRLRVDIENFRFVGGPREGATSEAPRARPQTQTQPQPAADAVPGPVPGPESEPMPSDDDVPF